MNLKVFLVKAFTQLEDQGNPAGVVLNADGLSNEQMLKVASILGFSETAFVQRSNKGDFKLRFFTPKHEVDLCGHATISTFYVMKEEGVFGEFGDRITKIQETNVGLLPVDIYKDGFIEMTQSDPVYLKKIKNINEIANLLSVSVDDIDQRYPVQIVSTGTPKLIIPIKNIGALFEIKPKLNGIIGFCQKNNVKGFYPFTFDVVEKDSDFHARQFNPLMGVNEDPITGVAAGALGAYIVKNKIFSKNKFILEQGYVLGKFGKVYIDVSDKVKVGGYAIVYGTKIIVV